MHLRPKCIPCLLSPITHLLLATRSLFLSLALSASLHKSFFHLPSSLLDLSPFVLDNFSLSFDRCQCDSMNSTIRFACDGAGIYATCPCVLYAPARMTYRCVEHIQARAYNVSNLGATMNGRTSRDTARSTWTLQNSPLRITCMQLLK